MREKDVIGMRLCPDLLHKDQGCFSGSSGSILGLERERLLGIGMDSLKEFTAVLINS